MMSSTHIHLLTISIALSNTNSFCLRQHHSRCFNNRVKLRSSNNDGYRSISDVVGGLHGGKYQFNGPGNIQSFDDGMFSGSGSGSCSDNHEEEELGELPNWARKMHPPAEQSIPSMQFEVVNIPSNSDPMDGLMHSASVTIQNQERTWEKFYAKIMIRNSDDGAFVELENGLPLAVRPRSGSLAPRGGASNACDASNPYSDSATIQIIHNNHDRGVFILPGNLTQKDHLWLIVGTEEEKWSYKLFLNE
jgi:hypothetical protein